MKAEALSEKILTGQQVMAIGWCFVEVCVMLDKGIDPRTIEVPALLERATRDLGEHPNE